MVSNKFAFPLMAQAETLLIYGLFLFLTGFSQLTVTISQRYLQLKSTAKAHQSIKIYHLFPNSWSISEIHLWYIYPSAAFTLIPFVACAMYVLFKKPSITFLICIASIISFISSSVYIGLLIIHNLEYWQQLSSYRFRSSSHITTTMSPTVRLLISNDEIATFSNLAVLITFTLALVQALLSMIGSVISCLWSPCCSNSWTEYTPISNQSQCIQTTPNRQENLSSTNVRTNQRSSKPEAYRYVTPGSNIDNETMYATNHRSKNSQQRNHYDDV